MKILIVDDSKLSRAFVKNILQEQDHIFIEAQEGREALSLFSNENPDLVLLDLTMPGMTGLDVLSKMKQINDRVKIIIATADVQVITKQEATRLGAAGYITKPFNAKELKKVVENIGKDDIQ
jgi:DNA-binding response OmpR family regulator